MYDRYNTYRIYHTYIIYVYCICIIYIIGYIYYRYVVTWLVAAYMYIIYMLCTLQVRGDVAGGSGDAIAIGERRRLLVLTLLALLVQKYKY